MMDRMQKRADGPYAELHSLIKEIIRHKENGNLQEAESLYQRIEPLSKQIVRLIGMLEQKAYARALSSSAE